MLALGFLLLLVALQAPILAAVGVVTNLLAVGAAFGVARLIFQEGHLAGLLGLEPQGFLNAWAPVFFFAMVFAISMDYTVFLLSSAKEHWDRTKDPREAMVGGVAHSGRVVFAAAAVMVAVFFTFALSRPAAAQGDGRHPRHRRPARRRAGPPAARPGRAAAARQVGVVAAQAAGPRPARRPLRPRLRSSMFTSRKHTLDLSTTLLELRAGRLVLFDVREGNERAADFIPGSRHLPLGQVKARLGELPRDKPVAFICQTGRRSAMATTAARARASTPTTSRAA